ncbi:MAG: hypothetical protein ACJAVZ_002020 [Afipia broomeae]|jgi:hypothetical protein|uniref:TonB C-terminal domain-containing protein n=1 Tax=Candidatus Afipia apatlaquensis TaxID=2712852 RepID=A0A7C9VLL8_9BRAD|nr:hypothetical protein [Candidatus Afipia apatlaquensis]RTL78518.1 MAG: hypothetical protein EKK35_13670 [Bradyrhizobiaceae bacterium]
MLAWVTGLAPLIVGPGSSASAQDVVYKPAAAAPAAWRAFAAELQGRLQERLATDDEATRRFHEYMNENNKSSPAFATVRAWVSQNGKLERIEFDGIDDAAVAANLRALLAGASVSTPPPDMLQPLRLRIGLRARNQQER